LAAVKIIEILGTSTKSWDDAAREALTEAKKSLRGITGIEILSQTAKVKDGEIAEFHATCKIAFRVE
jgi:flavin-binding protein dodecin